jgi:methyl-accepting chemotaxis protein
MSLPAYRPIGPFLTCIKEFERRRDSHLVRAGPVWSLPVFARGSIMKFSSATWMARNVSGMMEAARRSISAEMEHLSHTADDQFAEGFTALIADLEASFRDEESAMEALNYPALRSHREQHAQALSALHHAQPQVEGGDIGLGREVLTLLPKWLLMHRSTMDLALAATTRPLAGRSRRHQWAGTPGLTPGYPTRHHKAQARV